MVVATPSSRRGTVNAGSAYDLLSKGCEVAGGVTDPPGDGELSDLANGGKDQLNVGCTLDEHCDQSNPCLGAFQCISGTCEPVAGSAPVCDDNLKVSISQTYLRASILLMPMLTLFSIGFFSVRLTRAIPRSHTTC